MDGIGAFDLIVRAAMSDGLLSVDGGDSVLPYSERSQYLWEDNTGNTHLIHQGDGGEQGDSLMPLLFSGQNSSNLCSSPERVGAIYTNLESHARFQGKTKVEPSWNLKRAVHCKRLRMVLCPSEVSEFWGTLSALLSFVRSQSEQTSLKHKVLFNWLTHVEDLQSAWLVLLFCANTRAMYSLRVLPPQETEHFATEHDSDSEVPEKSSLRMSMGGCGYLSASRTSSSSCWASWASWADEKIRAMYLEEVAEHLCAFLDDIYLLCPPERVVPLYKLLSETLARVAGIRLHQGKTKVWNKAGTAPENVQELGPEACQPQGLKVLGTPIGTPEFARGNS